MKLKVQVTRLHIKTGRTSDCNFCPIALAFNMAFQKNNMTETGCLIGRYNVLIENNNKSEHLELPIKVQKFIDNYDRKYYKLCSPFSFTINIPERLL